MTDEVYLLKEINRIKKLYEKGDFFPRSIMREEAAVLLLNLKGYVVERNGDAPAQAFKRIIKGNVETREYLEV